MKKHLLKILLNALLLGVFLISCSNSKPNPQQKTNTHFNYLPTSTSQVVINHKYYSFSYIEKYEQAEWVAYVLNEDHIVSNKIKRPYFEQDSKVKTNSADWKNYKKSGYSRGHLMPAGDRKFNKEAFYETFLTSNISPQKFDFNAGVWNRLEQKTRYWAQKYDEIYVITGGVLTNNLKTIGYENVAIPKYF